MIRTQEWTCCRCGENGDYISRGTTTANCPSCNHAPCESCHTSGDVIPKPSRLLVDDTTRIISESPRPYLPLPETKEWSLEANHGSVNHVNDSSSAIFHGPSSLFSWRQTVPSHEHIEHHASEVMDNNIKQHRHAAGVGPSCNF